MTFLAALRSILFLIVFYAVTAVAVFAALPVALVGRGALRGYGMIWVRFHAWCVRWILGIRTVVEGDVPTGPVLVAAKHQSFFDPLDLVRILDAPAAVMKRQLADIPLWGWIARRYGAIPVDRSRGAAALRRMMREAEAAIADNRSILIFPEGTRVAPGSEPRLQGGFAGLYRRFGLSVVPVALDSGRLWPRRGLVRRSGIITIRFGEPLPPGLPREELERRVHQAINVLEEKA
ncbi:MAG TPA: lysophospholipid acyltransferase family protein [Allosphingosinicella sp.]|jgi:1-acyl-sn-glycerol-3-phosphate acyltransferase